MAQRVLMQRMVEKPAMALADGLAVCEQLYCLVPSWTCKLPDDHYAPFIFFGQRILSLAGINTNTARAPVMSQNYGGYLSCIYMSLSAWLQTLQA